MTKTRPPLEKHEDAFIRRMYRASGCVVISFSHPGKTMQTPGIPDLKVYDPKSRTSWWMEVKRQQGPGFLKVQSVQSIEQAWFQKLAEEHGEEYLIGARDVAEQKLRVMKRIV